MSDTQTVVFYIGAHQDDWQLFMSPQAYYDLIADNTRVVFMYTTAGDAGGDAGWRHGRRYGALSSIQFAKRQRIARITPEVREVNHHPIACYTIANTRSYCIDIADGFKDGSGFPATGHESIQRLREGTIPAANAIVDEPEYRTAYTSWQDLVDTIRAIMDLEASDETHGSSMVHIIDPSETEHSDHKYTSIAVEEAVAGDERYQLAMYEEYITPSKPENVTGEDLIWKTGLYLFYAQTAFEESGVVEHLDKWHLSFIARQYRTK
jgi:LmbE family N-acetylglucosaminyl deacetylase